MIFDTEFIDCKLNIQKILKYRENDGAQIYLHITLKDLNAKDKEQIKVSADA